MTDDERDQILSLVAYPGDARKGSREEVLRHFEVSDGAALGARLLSDSVEQQDADDVELALIVCDTFGVSPECLPLLVGLTSGNWHHSHEAVVSALDQLRSPAAIEALYSVTQWIPDYLEFDENRALAVKAIWALGNIAEPEGVMKLRLLSEADDEILRENARKQLKRRE